MPTLREQYRGTMSFEAGGTPPDLDVGPLLPAYERWVAEGLRPDLDPRDWEAWCAAFGIGGWPRGVAVSPPRQPLFPEQVMSESETTRTVRRGDGSIIEEFKGSAQSIPHEIRPAVTCRAEWEKLKEWLQPDAALPAADAPWLAKAFATARGETLPVFIHAGSLMGTPRNWLGFQEFAVLPYEDPEWFADLVDVQCRLAAWQIRVFGENRVPVEGIHFWEDICYKNGPIISPAHFREFIVPRYRELRDLAAGYGYRLVSVDSDGNLWALLDGWAEGGVNVLGPFEVQAGMDVNEVQARFFGRVAMAGGIHKHRLTGGEREIAVELERVKPAVERGGYLPALDHNVPADVSFHQYLTYRRLKAEILGIGQPVDETRVRR